MKAESIGSHLLVLPGAVNVGIVMDGERALLIDFGAGEALKEIGELGIRVVEKVLFTHHHRDQACGIWLLGGGTRIGVPEAERRLFEDPASYWDDPSNRWHVYGFRPHHLTLAEPVPVHEAYRGGDSFEWGPARVSVVDTPGHTDGGVSYLVDVDGQRAAFCGDLIFEGGKLWEIYSLQKGTATADYHGFLGARRQLVESLGRLKEARPSALVPSRGAVIRDPASAIDALSARLGSCYDMYASISALRYYFPALFGEYAGDPRAMPIGQSKPAPDFLRHFKTTWIIISRDGAAFAIDCGDPSVVGEVGKLQAAGEVGSVEGLWITHYHDDHVDAVPEFKEAFRCPVFADRRVAEVVEDPLAWRLPCVSPVKVQVDRRTEDGESWRWREFEMTAYHFPGQTLYHGGLFVEGRGARVFFVGDSFTAAGIDDYCCGNRNFLGRGRGFDRCIALLESLEPCLLVNNHVDQAFDFTRGQREFMRKNLEERMREFGELIAWDDPNYGMDEHWIRCFPYEQRVARGSEAKVQVVFTNHSSEPREASCRASLPRSWGSGATEFAGSVIQPRREGSVPISFEVPEKIEPKRYVVPVDAWYSGRFLPQVSETIIRVERQR
ncbi:MAG: MBL fold metallo-hydrolase [Candidatus Brockarchaeota archaeon]|nr:MBL fold metallo-hydrolase [Candidatus Brockarchaeota archaeon]